MPDPLESGLRTERGRRRRDAEQRECWAGSGLGGAWVSPGENDPGRERRRSEQFRYASLGLEFGAGIAGCVLLGYWVDRTFGTANKGVIIGAIVGCVGGMYHLVTRALRLQRKAELDRRRPRGVQDDPGPDADDPGPDA